MPNIDKQKLRLPDGEYFAGNFEKTGICIHHTVGGSAESTLNWWKRDTYMIGTAYIIGRDGKIYEVFNPRSWAWQFGLGWDRNEKINFEKRFIGIEIASEGGLTEHQGKLYCFDRILPKTLKKETDKIFDYGVDYRGYRYFDQYEDAQIDSLGELLNHLCDTFNIKRQYPDNPLEFHGQKLKNFEGIIGHNMIRIDKTDPLPDVTLWNTLENNCNIKKMGVNDMNDVDKNNLFEHNIKELNKMNIAAGAMVKGLLMELERDARDTYIKLRDAVNGGHVVKYDFVQGDQSLVYQIANALGFKSVTDDTLEVRNV
jgi:hypothetical protein